MLFLHFVAFAQEDHSSLEYSKIIPFVQVVLSKYVNRGYDWLEVWGDHFKAANLWREAVRSSLQKKIERLIKRLLVMKQRNVENLLWWVKWCASKSALLIIDVITRVTTAWLRWCKDISIIRRLTVGMIRIYLSECRAKRKTLREAIITKKEERITWESTDDLHDDCWCHLTLFAWDVDYIALLKASPIYRVLQWSYYQS